MIYLQEKIIHLSLFFKESETVIDDLQAALVDFLPELQKEFDLGFVQVERSRQYLNDRSKPAFFNNKNLIVFTNHYN